MRLVVWSAQLHGPMRLRAVGVFHLNGALVDVLALENLSENHRVAFFDVWVCSSHGAYDLLPVLCETGRTVRIIPMGWFEQA